MSAHSTAYGRTDGPSLVITHYGPTVEIDGQLTRISGACNVQDPETGSACSHREGCEGPHSWQEPFPSSFFYEAGPCTR